MLRIAAYTRYDDLAASTRQRVLQYEPFLNGAGFQLFHRPLLPNDYVRSLATAETFPKRRLAWRYLQRMFQLTRETADVLWIYSELFPFLPLVERFALITRLPIVYDFDDAFFHRYDGLERPFLRRILGRKLQPLLEAASACCCGNSYLQLYAAQFCSRSIILPTVVDTNLYLPMPHEERSIPVIGWIGSPSTWPMVRPLLPLLRELVRESKALVRVIGAGAGAERDIFPGLELSEWSQETEVSDVQSFDVGIMPLSDSPFERGKSGYKLVQYMACGIPVVASPVGVNAEIVRNGVNGYLATLDHEWRDALLRLLSDPELRRRLGAAGRDRAVSDYSLAVHAPRLVDVFREVAREPSSS